MRCKGMHCNPRRFAEHSRADVPGKSEITSIFVTRSMNDRSVFGSSYLQDMGHGCKCIVRLDVHRRTGATIQAPTQLWRTGRRPNNCAGPLHAGPYVGCTGAGDRLLFARFSILLLASWFRTACMSIDLTGVLTSTTLWAALRVAAPVLLAALLVRRLVSAAYVMTQIQKISLTFVLRLLSVVAVLVIAGAVRCSHTDARQGSGTARIDARPVPCAGHRVHHDDGIAEGDAR